MADLQESFDEMNDAQQQVTSAVDEKMGGWTKFDKEVAALSKAKNEKDFKKQKEKCLTALRDVVESMALQAAAQAAWAEKVSAARVVVTAERKKLAELKQKLTETAQKTEAHNKVVAEFNKTPEGKKQPRKLLPVVDPLKATNERQNALDAVELEVAKHESFIKVAKERASRESQVLDREQKKLEKMEFTDKSKKK